MTAIAAVGAVAVAAFAVYGAGKAAGRQEDISNRLLAIEAERDHARLQVLPNLYVGPGAFLTGNKPPPPGTEVAVLISVANIGSAVGGPVRVSIADDFGLEHSGMRQEPLFIDPGEVRSFVVWFRYPKELAPGPNPITYDLARRGGSDFPSDREEKFTNSGWQPATIAEGYFIRAWDPTTGENWWYPEDPQEEPPEAPFVD